jgi:chromosomal replication initiator protein
MLEGAIKRIGFYMENKNNVKYTYNIISNIFKNLEIDQSELTPSRIISVIANYYKINKSDIKGKSRKKEFVFPRHVSIYLIRQMTNLSQKEIGRIFGNRDHSTIINAIKNIDKKIKIDKAHKLAIEQIERKIKKIS